MDHQAPPAQQQFPPNAGFGGSSPRGFGGNHGGFNNQRHNNQNGGFDNQDTGFNNNQFDGGYTSGFSSDSSYEQPKQQEGCCAEYWRQQYFEMGWKSILNWVILVPHLLFCILFLCVFDRVVRGPGFPRELRERLLEDVGIGLIAFIMLIWTAILVVVPAQVKAVLICLQILANLLRSV